MNFTFRAPALRGPLRTQRRWWGVQVWQSGDCQEDIVSSTAGTKAAEVAEAIVKDEEKDQGMFMVRPTPGRSSGLRVPHRRNQVYLLRTGTEGAQRPLLRVSRPGQIKKDFQIVFVTQVRKTPSWPVVSPYLPAPFCGIGGVHKHFWYVV